MNFVKFVIVFLSSILLFVSCDDTDPVDQDFAALSSLDGNSFVFEVKLASTTVYLEYPYEEQDESDYIEVSDNLSHNVIFSEDGDIVTIEQNFYVTRAGETDAIEQDFIVGQLSSDSIESAEYLFDEGGWVGGRFVVWIEDESFKAELTYYGSGVPVVSSERGILTPAE